MLARKCIILLLPFLTSQLASAGFDPPPSPCPGVFDYDQRRIKNRWFGNITVVVPETTNGLQLDIDLDRPAHLLGNWKAEVTSRDNTHFSIRDSNRKLQPGHPLKVRIFVKFAEAGPVPQIAAIRVNGVQICPGYLPDFVIGPVSESPPPVSSTVLPPREGENNKPALETTLIDIRGGCGTVQLDAAPLITNGQQTLRGQWPWHVAIYKSKEQDLSYICGGSLVSSQVVITAAHCVTKTYTTRAEDPEKLVLYFGKYHLKFWSEERGVQSKQVDQIHVHPTYNNTNFYGDIAILILASPVEFTIYVRPVCVWSARSDLSDVVDKDGTVIGWGRDETGSLTEELMMARMPVVSQQTCLWSKPDFFPRFTSNRTFCAGFRNGTSVCNGDSGGGMVFPIDEHGKEVWHLRGIVSVSVPKEGERICNTNHYVIFADVAKYTTWIAKYI